MDKGILAGLGVGCVVDHVGIAVRSIEQASGFYQALGFTAGEVEMVEGEGVRVSMLGAGEGRVELLEALGEQTVIGRFLARQGEGLHHVALRVRELDRVCEEMTGRGVSLVGNGLRVGAGGHRYRFVHPESTGGALVELVEVAE